MIFICKFHYKKIIFKEKCFSFIFTKRKKNFKKYCEICHIYRSNYIPCNLIDAKEYLINLLIKYSDRYFVNIDDLKS